MNECTSAILIFALLSVIAFGAQAAPTAAPLAVAATANPSGDADRTLTANEPAKADGGPTDAGTKAATTDLDALTAHTWQWVSFTNRVKSFDVEGAADYTLTFNSDGIVRIVADCNTAIASYGVASYEAGSLSMVVAPKTKAACPSESRGDQFLLLLGRAARYFFKSGQLVIDLMAGRGTMVFAPAEAGSPTSPSAREPGTPGPQH